MSGVEHRHSIDQHDTVEYISAVQDVAKPCATRYITLLSNLGQRCATLLKCVLNIVQNLVNATQRCP